ncbi:MAG: hypothetical protein J6B97_09860 [Bacteroidales bacterium]|nr:hypothetical protein [Bacteroidales bacterium]MBP3444297.1 hypothetical protein [Methanocorpusculaceae archaeon]
MATTQYIGARYVPRFYENSSGTAEWRSGVMYEPLTIVTYNGNSYTSKIPVPASVGNPSDNPTYWVSTGIFNQQVETLQNTVNALSDRVETVEGVQEDQADQITEITTKRVIFIGDSYGTGEGSEGPVTPYIVHCANALGLAENSTYWKNAVGGASFKGYNGRRSFKSLLEDVKVPDASAIDLIVVSGGINDATTGATVSDNITAVHDFITYAKGRFVNAEVLVCLLGWTNRVNTNLQIVKLSEPAYRYATSYGAKFVDMRGANHDYINFMSDGSHPKQDGARAIGWALANVIMGGECITGAMQYRQLNVSAYTDNFTNAPTVQQYIDAHNAYVSIGKSTLTAVSGFTMNSDSDVIIGTFTGNNYINSIANLGMVPVLCRIQGNTAGGGAQEDCNATIAFDALNGQIKLHPIFVTAFTSVTRVILFSQMNGAIPLSFC